MLKTLILVTVIGATNQVTAQQLPGLPSKPTQSTPPSIPMREPATREWPKSTTAPEQIKPNLPQRIPDLPTNSDSQLFENLRSQGRLSPGVKVEEFSAARAALKRACPLCDVAGGGTPPPACPGGPGK
jgi:hypothetical protein